MDRSAVFVDAGYLFAAAGQLVCGTRSRASLNCDVTAFATGMAEWVHTHSGGLDSLRTYWYDGAPNAVPMPDHELIGGLPYVKVRLGRLIQGARANQSAALNREADEHVVLPRTYWEPFLTPRQDGRTTPNANAAMAQAAGRAFGSRWLGAATQPAFAAMQEAKPRIPHEVDRSLLVDAEALLGSLRERDDLKREVRAAFWSEIDEAARPGALPVDAAADPDGEG